MDLYSIKLYANIVTYYQRKAILIYHNKICKIPSDFVIILKIIQILSIDLIA